MEYLPRALNATSTKLAIVGTPADTNDLTTFLLQTYPGIDTTVLFDCNCTLAFLEAYNSSMPLGFDAFTSNYIMTFETEAAMEAYTQLTDYGMNQETPGLYAAVVLTQMSGLQRSYKIRVNATSIPDTHTVADDYQRGVVFANIQQYVYSTPFSGDTSTHPLPFEMPGFVQLQAALDKYIINATGPGAVSDMDVLNFYTLWGCVPEDWSQLLINEPAVQTFLSARLLLPQAVTVAPFPTSPYKNTDFYSFVSNVFALIFVLSFFFPSFFLIRGIVVEKETKIREGMRMMGLSDAALFTAWYITYGILFLIIAFFIAVTTGLTFFSNSDGGLIFLYFFLFGCTAISLCFLLSTFFSKAKLASAVGAVIFIAAFFPYYQVNDVTSSHAAKSAASLLSPVAFGLAIDILSTLESNGVGLHWSNVYTNINGDYSFGTALTFMFFDFFLYTALGIYLGNVLPQDFGVPMPFYYPFTRKYWSEKSFCCCYTGRAKRSQPVRSPGGMMSINAGNDGGDAPLLMEDNNSGNLPFPGARSRFEEIGLASGDRFEAAGLSVRDLAREGRCVSIRGLTKEFNTPDGIKRAVDNLDLDMFESQCFVLLGHNGAGKSTTISMLTGLIPPSGGDAYMYGLSMREDMATLRQSLGVCPQHDVLWPDITVKEHLIFFAGIKGVPKKEVQPMVMQMIREVGLIEKTNVRSAELSGGQKRKLSVAIALIGGSKVVFLDEPTSGMDPYSRRFTWNLLQSNRAGRVMVLTTHFMDEADVLGDRIGIMANGDIRCCGSSMFLKKRYVVLYMYTGTSLYMH
jgi:ATP-binding cassette subfamily A (ABC1) protein 3